jgi:hypothetical protein
MTCQEFINSTLRLIGVLDSGEAPSTSESSDAFAVLNQLISNWSAAGAPVYSLTKQTVALTGLGEYVLATRPLKIRSAAVIASGGIAQDLTQYSAEQWTTIRDRQRTGALAEVFFYDGAYPSGTIRIWPIPTAGSLELWTIQQLAPFASLSQNISLPPGYEQALRFALAQALAPEYGSVLAPEIASGAAEAKTAIAQLNMQVLGGAPAAPAVAAT